MIEIILLILGLITLIKSADFLVDAASSIAKKFHISPAIIGLTILAFGTSLPELFVNVIAAINNSSQVALGNIVGSNIANILLVLGITGLLTQIKVKKNVIYKEIPFALLASLILLVMVLDKTKTHIGFYSGLILILFLAIFMYYVLSTIKNKNKDSIIPTTTELKINSTKKDILFLIIGSIGLYFGGEWTVNGAVFLAKLLNLSEFFISATIVAIGTSLPELVTSIIAAKKKETDMAIGNVVGSNILNIFWVLGFTSIIKPIQIPPFIYQDLIIVSIATFILFFSLFISKKHLFRKRTGILFIISYICYIAFILLRG